MKKNLGGGRKIGRAILMGGFGLMSSSVQFGLAHAADAVVGAGAAVESPEEYTTPYIDPITSCSRGLHNPIIGYRDNEPVEKQFRYLFSRDCKIVFVLPPAVMAQNIRQRGMNLSACGGVKLETEQIVQQDELIQSRTKELLALELKWDAAKTPHEGEKIQTKIDQMTKKISGYRETKDQSVAKLQELYGALPGVQFSVTMSGDVEQSDLRNIYSMNDVYFAESETKVIYERDANGNFILDSEGKQKITTVSVPKRTLQVAPISSSFYSFESKLPVGRNKNGSILSTNIPGFEYLTQGQNPDRGTIHIRATGAVTGDVVMNLITACEHVDKKADGEFALKDQKIDPFFSVNRTLEVQQMFGQGFVAKLKVDELAKQISRTITTETNHNFNKKTIFGNDIQANILKFLDFQWTSERDSVDTPKFQDILGIRNAVAAKLVDSYLEELVNAKLVTPMPLATSAPVAGGVAPEQRVGQRCWSESNSGFLGFGASRSTHCENYTYSVDVWHDGVTEDNLTSMFKMYGQTVETMLVRSMAPFYFTTAFANVQ